jgi:hypothetical protein
VGERRAGGSDRTLPSWVCWSLSALANMFWHRNKHKVRTPWHTSAMPLCHYEDAPSFFRSCNNRVNSHLRFCDGRFGGDNKKEEDAIGAEQMSLRLTQFQRFLEKLHWCV